MRYKHIFVLSGSGLSAESGVKTFRDNNGLWEEHRVEDVATPEAFARDPKLVYRFYNLRRQQLKEVAPNPAHQALARLQREASCKITLVTQNVDDLLDRAGAKEVLHMHGELRKARCVVTENVFNWEDEFDASTLCPCCRRPGNLRPHIVWFGEMPFYLDEIQEALTNCDLFLCVGTSGVVYPAAGFVQLATSKPCMAIECNREQTQISQYFDRHILGPAGETVPTLVDELLGSIIKLA